MAVQGPPPSPAPAGEGGQASRPEPLKGAGSGRGTSAPGRESQPVQAALPGAPAGREWVIEFPPGIPLLSLNGREHWAARNRKARALKDAAIVMARKARLPALERVTVIVIYDPPDRRRRDADNVVAKPLIDGLVAAGVLRDDNFRHVASSTTEIGPEPFPRGRLRMIIAEVGGAA